MHCLDCSLHSLALPCFFFIQASKANGSFKFNKRGTLLGITGFGLRPSAIQSRIINYLFFTYFQEAENQSDISIGAFFSNSTLIFLPPETSCYHTGGHMSSLLESCPAWMADFSREVSSLSQVWGEVCSLSFLSPHSHV